MLIVMEDASTMVSLPDDPELFKKLLAARTRERDALQIAHRRMALEKQEIEAQAKALEAQKQAIEIGPVQLPASRRPAVDMDEMRARIPADAAPAHGESRLLHPAEIAVEGDVDRPADDVLAVLGHPEGGGREHLVGLLGPIGREHGGMALVGRGHDVGQKIQHGEIDRPGLVGVEIPKEDSQIRDRAGQGAGGVAIGAVEGLPGVGVLQVKAMRLGRAGKSVAAQKKADSGREQQVPSPHPGTVPVGIVLALSLFDEQAVGHRLYMGRIDPVHKVCSATSSLRNPAGTRPNCRMVAGSPILPMAAAGAAPLGRADPITRAGRNRPPIIG